MLHVVLDTNIYISAVLFGGIPEKVIKLIRRDHVLVYSSTILTELSRILSVKFHWSRAEIEETYDFLFASGGDTRLCNPQSVPAVSRDANDDHVIACATASGADVIVTGDKDLLVLSPYHDIHIMTPAAFLTYAQAA